MAYLARTHLRHRQRPWFGECSSARLSRGWSESGTREIGRASCRERVEISVVAVSLKKKQTYNDDISYSIM